MTNDETIQQLLKLKMPAFVAGFRPKGGHQGRTSPGQSGTDRTEEIDGVGHV